jgi:hypothetical protein
MRRPKRRIKKYRGLVAVSRLGLAVVAVALVVSGVTFAILQSQNVKLTGNTIETATANIQISQDGGTYGSALTGFSFSNIVPGGQAMPLEGYSFHLKNSGGTPLALRMSVTSSPVNTGGIDLSKVNVLLTAAGSASPQSFPLSALIAAGATGGVLINAPSQIMPGTNVRYILQVSMEAGAVNNSGASLDNVDFAFSGVAI